MKKKTVSGLLSTLLLLGMLTVAFDVQQVKASPAVSPCIAVVPASTVSPTLTPGMNYTISIYTDYDGDDIWGYEFMLAYNPDVLEGVDVVNGDLITGTAAQFLTVGFNNTAGVLRLTGGFFFWIIGDPPMTSGPGILANVTFSVVGFGKSPITLNTTPNDPYRTKLYGYYHNETEQEWVLFTIIDSGTMPDHIQHGFFSNAAATPATIDIDPDTLNLYSKGEWMTCYIELPEGYNVSDIDIYSVKLNDTFPVSPLPNPPVPVPTEIGDYDNDTIPDLMVKFNRTEVTSWIYNDLDIQYGDVTLMITGELLDGTPFEGTVMIRVLFPGDVDGDGYVGSVDAGMLNGAYGTSGEDPLYVLSADFDQDGYIGSADAGILNGNYGRTAE